jgi:glucose 1-dehydrogenase
MMQKTVLITGAAGGIGRATVTLFSSKGWHVIGVDRDNSKIDYAKENLFIRADISRSEELESIFSKAKDFTGCLNALVNNAAMQIAKPILDTSMGCRHGFQSALGILEHKTGLSSF